MMPQVMPQLLGEGSKNRLPKSRWPKQVDPRVGDRAMQEWGHLAAPCAPSCQNMDVGERPQGKESRHRRVNQKDALISFIRQLRISQ